MQKTTRRKKTDSNQGKLQTFSNEVSIQLAELDKSNDEQGNPKREIVMTCLQEGPGNPVDKRWYQKSCVEGLESKIYARRKVFVDHLITPEAKEKGDSLHDWAATVMKTWLDVAEGKVVRKVRLKIHEDWLWRRCEDAPGEIALSIEGRGAGEKGMIDEQEYTIISDIPYLSAFKFVPYPGNARMGADLVEQEQATATEEETMDLSKLTLELLREARPDLMSEIEKVVSEMVKKEASAAAKKVEEAAAKEKSELSKVSEGLKSQVAELEGKVKVAEEAAKKVGSEKENDLSALSEQFRKEMKDGFAEQSKVIDGLREEDHGLKQRLDEKEVKEKFLAKEQLIDRLIGEAELPADAITPLFKEDLKRLSEKKDGDKTITVDEQIRERIAERKKLCVGGEAQVTESGADKPGDSAVPKDGVEEQVMVDEAFHRKYSKEYGMDLTPKTALAEWRKRRDAGKVA